MNGQSRLQQAQEDVEEVKVIMLDNMKKSNERTEKLTDLDARAKELEEQSNKFVKTTAKVKQKKQWENMKYKVIIGAIVAAVILLGIIVIVVASSGGSDDSNNTSTATQSTKAPGDG